MRALPSTLASLVAVLLVVSPVATAQEAEDADSLLKQGFVSLFNGNDLTGWKVPQGDNGHWKVVDSVIDYDAMSEASGNKSLFTEQSFEDFVLHVEWRFKRTAGKYPMPIILPDGSLKTDDSGEVIKTPTPNADSGILLRGGPQVNLWCWPVGSGELWNVRNNDTLPAATRAAAVPKCRADKPVGQWNAMDITLQGDRITIILNGKNVIDDAQIPGIPESGPLGLQHHGGGVSERQREQLSKRGFVIEDAPTPMHPASSLIQFRNIYIKRS